MNDCTSMRELMLEAELAELVGDGTSALARHVRRCAACRAVARSLAADTDALALLVATAPRPAPSAPERIRGGVLRMNRAWRGPRAYDVALALPLAAAIVVALVWLPGHDSVPGATGSPLSGGAGTSHSTPVSAPRVSSAALPVEAEHPPTVASRPATARRANDSGSGGGRFVRVSPIAVVPIVTSVALTATISAAAQSSPPPHDVDAVGVTPERGSRAVVMGTRDPAVTVVWLY